jgi:hypothetical protein
MEIPYWTVYSDCTQQRENLQTEPVFVNVDGAQESFPRNRYLGSISKRFTNKGSVQYV